MIGDGSFDFSGPYFGGPFFSFSVVGSAPMFGDLASFYGTGNLGLDIEIIGRNVPLSEVTARGVQTITYLFNVPEPSGLVLGSIGLAGVTWYGRRRRTQSRCPYSPGRFIAPAGTRAR
jgi:PEP-CTERM motif-containing protein